MHAHRPTANFPLLQPNSSSGSCVPVQPYSTGEVDIVLECTGAYLNRKVLQPYFDIGVKKVQFTAVH